MTFADELGALPPIASVLSASACLDKVLGPSSWKGEYRYMSPTYCVLRVEVVISEDAPPQTVVREGTSIDGLGQWTSADVAFLRAYELLGGKVQWPRPAPPLPAPKPSGTKSAQPLGSVLPNVAHKGPMPFNDSNTDIHSVMAPKPPSEPEWFGSKIGGFATKRDATWTKEMTWREAVQIEIQSPGGMDQPLGFIRWKLGKDAPPDPKLRQPWAAFVGRAKAAVLWYEQRREQLNEEYADAPAEDYGPGAEDTPF